MTARAASPPLPAPEKKEKNRLPPPALSAIFCCAVLLASGALLVPLEPADAVLISKEDNAKYAGAIKWSWDSRQNRNIGVMDTKIVITNVTQDRIDGYIADNAGTRLFMFNDEQLVLTRYVYDGNFLSDWEIQSKFKQGFFSFQVPLAYKGKINTVQVYVGQNQYSINDGTAKSGQSWVFTSSARLIFDPDTVLVAEAAGTGNVTTATAATNATSTAAGSSSYPGQQRSLPEEGETPGGGEGGAEAVGEIVAHAVALGESSRVEFKPDYERLELEVEIIEGELADGLYNVTFFCNSPFIFEEFVDMLEVIGGDARSEVDFAMASGTYSDCEVMAGDLLAPLQSLAIPEVGSGTGEGGGESEVDTAVLQDLAATMAEGDPVNSQQGQYPVAGSTAGAVGGNATGSASGQQPGEGDKYLEMVRMLVKMLAEKEGESEEELLARLGLQEEQLLLQGGGANDKQPFLITNNATGIYIVGNNNQTFQAASNTRPVILDMPNHKVEANHQAGARIHYSAKALDAEQGDISSLVTCNPPSGSFFAVSRSETVVTCHVTDNSGATATETFSIRVVDTGKPIFWTSANREIVAEGNGLGGAGVYYSLPLAFDIIDPVPTVVCSRMPGSFFPLGSTSVACIATDDAGNVASTIMKVTVIDTTKPQIVSAPSDLTFVAPWGSSKAVVQFAVSATDVVDGNPAVTCHAEDGTRVSSGSWLGVGAYKLTCTAADDSGNLSAPMSFSLKVTYSSGQYK